MIWAITLSAVALVLVIEGVLPFLAPKLWKETMLRLAKSGDNRVRVMGLVSMLLGTLIMILVHSNTF